MANCIFCNIVARKVPANILYDDDHVVAFKDLNPQAPVHVLIVPKEHIATVNDLDANDHSKMGKLVHVAKLLAEKLGIAQKGFRLVLNCNPAGGQSVYHSISVDPGVRQRERRFRKPQSYVRETVSGFCVRQQSDGSDEFRSRAGAADWE